MSGLRILVTGSREWRDWDLVRNALVGVLGEYTTIGAPVLVHGGQESRDPDTGERYGADYIADQVWRELANERPGWFAKPEIHPYKRELGKRGGPVRNQEMVDAGATICLAFPLPGSRGTWDCVKRAQAAGITTMVVPGDAS